MEEMTQEQQQALAIASARLRLQQQKPEQTPQQKPAQPGFVEGIATSLGASPEVAKGIGMAVNAIPPVNAMNLVNEGSKWLADQAYNAGGAVTDFLANRGASPDVAAGAGFAANMASQTLPQMGMGAGRLAAPAIRNAAEGLMTRAINPSFADMANGKAARAISTFLDQGLNPTTVAGRNTLRQYGEKLENELDSLIKNSDKKVEMADVLKPVQEKLDFFMNQAKYKGSKQAIIDAWDEFMSHPLIAGRADGKIPIQVAQDIKRGTYQNIGEKAYGELKTPGTEAEKAIARGLKEGIARQEPAAAGLNAQMGDIFNALNVSERAALQALKSNPANIGILAANPKAYMAYTAGKSARFKAALANVLNENQNIIGVGIGAGIGGAAAGFTESQMPRNQ